MKTNDVRTYKIEILGHVVEEDISQTSPHQFRLELGPDNNTSIMLQADQSGLIGLFRHIHGLGLVILSVHSSQESTRSA